MESTFDSNALEGSTLTLRETVLIVKEGIVVGEGKPIRDVFAAKGYADGFDAIFVFVDKRRECNAELIKSFHWYVTVGTLPQESGVWRDHDVRVVGAAFKPVPFWEIPEKIEELTAWFNETTDLHPIEKAAQFHAAFETIHPFSDGNGRVGYYAALAEYNETSSADKLTILIADRAADQLRYCLVRSARQKRISSSDCITAKLANVKMFLIRCSQTIVESIDCWKHFVAQRHDFHA